VSIVEIEGRTTRVLATDGLTFLGGHDFDMRIYDEAVERFREMGVNIEENDWILMDACEKAKKALSKMNSVRINHIRYGNKGFDLTYQTFVDLCEDLFDQTIALTDKVIGEAKINEKDLSDIVLVGGSTRIRKIRELLRDRFPNKRIRDDIEPDLAVAQGAAILADSLSNLERKESVEMSLADISLVDVTP
ncbi:hypothetical protein PFISCL1PPCAC_23604, partial [Pristionchus fissidentatus]